MKRNTRNKIPPMWIWIPAHTHTHNPEKSDFCRMNNAICFIYLFMIYVHCSPQSPNSPSQILWWYTMLCNIWGFCIIPLLYSFDGAGERGVGRREQWDDAEFNFIYLQKTARSQPSASRKWMNSNDKVVVNDFNRIIYLIKINEFSSFLHNNSTWPSAKICNREILFDILFSLHFK